MAEFADPESLEAHQGFLGLSARELSLRLAEAGVGAAAAQLDCDVRSVYGAGFAECLGAPPRSAFLAEGSVVRVFRGRLLDP